MNKTAWQYHLKHGDWTVFVVHGAVAHPSTTDLSQSVRADAVVAVSVLHGDVVQDLGRGQEGVEEVTEDTIGVEGNL